MLFFFVSVKAQTPISDISKQIETIFEVSPDSAVTLLSDYIEANKKHYADTTVGYLYLFAGNLNIQKSDYYSALHDFTAALELFEQSQYIKGSAQVLTAFGETYYKLEKFNTGIEYLQSASDYVITIGDSTQSSRIHRIIGQIYTAQGKRNKAIKQFNIALLYAKRLNQRHEQIATYFAISDMYSSGKEYDKATEQLKMVLKHPNASNNDLLHATYNMGVACDSMNKKQQTQYFYYQALSIALRNKDTVALFECNRSIGMFYCNNKQYDSAAHYLQQASDKAWLPLQVINSYYAWYLFYEVQQNTMQALRYYKLYTKHNLMYITSKSRSELTDMQIKYSGITKTRKLEQQKNQINNQQTIIRTIFIVLLFVIVIFFMVLRRNRERKRANTLLSEQNKRIELAHAQLQKANETLVLKERQLTDIIQHIPVIINAIGNNGEFIFWNKECEIVTGYSTAEIVGNPDALGILYSDSTVVEAMKKSFDKNIDYQNYETTISCKNGSRRTISWSRIPISAPVQGWAEWAVGIDVTERKRFENSLMQEKALLKSLIDAIPDFIFYKDTNGVYLGYNKAFANFYQIDKQEYVGKCDADIFEGEKRKLFEQSDSKVLWEKTTWHNRTWENLPTGEKILTDTIKLPFADEQGHVLGLVGICRDVTLQYQNEQEIRQAKERAEESDKLKSAFLANMSHEIRSPMNAIIGFAELLYNNENLSNEAQRKYLSYINSSGHDLLNLIDDIIDTAKIEAGQLTIKKSMCLINQMLDEIQASFNEVKKQKNKEHIAINLSLASSNNELAINTDGFRIKQVMSNLIGNAIKFTEQGYVEFGYTFTTDNFIQFFVKDTGVGIVADKQQLIFERFFKIDDSFTKNHGGTGLGLAICRTIIELLGGKIWVQSEPGNGATFFFTIPNETIQINQQPETSTAKANVTMEWSNHVVLIAEDTKINFVLLQRMLQKTNIQILWAKNGQEALDMCQNNANIELVLMDMQMPIMNGFEATRQIRAIMPELPIIAQTAFAMSDEQESALEAGCNDYITKPISQEVLFGVINKFLKKE